MPPKSGRRENHAPGVVEALRRLVVSRGDVVDLGRTLIVVDKQVKLYGGSKRGLAVLAPHNPEHFAILPFSLNVHEAENDG